jgi:transcriptional regulator with XRE-family HTH domain
MGREKSTKLNIAGPLIRRLRKSNDWTQKDFAILLRDAGWKDCNRRWVTRLEAGEVTLRDVDLPYLHKVLGESFSSALLALVNRTSDSLATASDHVSESSED